MKYGLIYRSEWLMMDDATAVQVNLYKTDVLIDDADDPTIINMAASGNPLTVSVVDNNKDKLTAIKAKQAVIEVLTSVETNISVFTGGPDNLWYCEITVDTEILFRGFLVSADIIQSYMPDAVVLQLTASDGLGLLKDVNLTDFENDTPVGARRLATFIAYCLYKTGLERPIYTVNNLRHGSGERTFDTFFSFSGQYFVTTGIKTNYFYVGQEIAITGTASNNGTRIVTAVDNTGTITQVSIDAAIVLEDTTATFTDTSSAGHFYNTVYLDAKTFESEEGECEDCYTVLEKILKEDCYLTQYNGDWWIIRVDEFDENDIYITKYNSSGAFEENLPATTLNKLVGSGEALFPLADWTVERERPLNYGKEVFRYNTALEIPCNSDLNRGDVIDDTFPEKTYTVDCWTLREGVPGFYGSVDGTTATIHKIYNANDYEIDRYVVLTPRTSFETSSINDATYLESEGIEIFVKDKFTASVQWRLDQDIATGGNGNARLFRCVLHGNDGSWWVLGEATTGDGIPKWYDTASWSLFTANGDISVDFDEDMTEWRTISWEAPPAPVTGTLYMWFNQFNQLSSSDDNREIWYTGFSFNYIALINGTYQKFTGQYQKVTRTDLGYLNKREDEVYMSDSPRPFFKGAMKIIINDTLQITTQFFPYNIYPASDPPDDKIAPFGEHQIWAVWNQGVYANWIFNGSIKGLNATWPDIIHKYTLTDPTDQTVERYFMLTSFKQDWKLGIMDGTWIEVYDRALMKRYSDTREFKYITNG
jgi:hypothetical protein